MSYNSPLVRKVQKQRTSLMWQERKIIPTNNSHLVVTLIILKQDVQPIIMVLLFAFYKPIHELNLKKKTFTFFPTWFSKTCTNYDYCLKLAHDGKQVDDKKGWDCGLKHCLLDHTECVEWSRGSILQGRKGTQHLEFLMTLMSLWNKEKKSTIGTKEYKSN